ncbi:metal ABC transporter permease [Thiorhodovibrio frisius]|uniref:ABC-type Mn2+/Zn2+ transport system, permease component n=1 Tax=Thiorhodovibrio frisius TaxID=631362 RepID=H8YZS6_9GAMM|nr:metal ABC transporter permease [Thiorhodovibrio frisius]EIC22203.1 ABC-type Mn2+/Zn2+ transport system, permease component [Thiorhodovibrio frisius]WPL24497.1 Manganese transport system membrane protein MntB [Thiorhodovibrio frisius]
MTEFFGALTQHSFLQQALLAGLLASLGCGLMGPFVVVKRITFLAGGIAHSVLAGMGAGVYFGFDPLLGALVAAVIAALLIGWVRLYSDVREDTTIGALWAIGMAVGILFIAAIPGYTSDLMSFLFGNILLVPKRELLFMGLLDTVLLISLTLFYRQFVALAFDEEFARLRGIPVGPLYLALLVLVAITVVLMIQVVGLILVIALLTLPAAIAGLWTSSLAMMMLLATLLGVLLTSGGLALSYAPDWPVGPSIIVLAGSAYIVALVARHLWQAWRRQSTLASGGGSAWRAGEQHDQV